MTTGKKIIFLLFDSNNNLKAFARHHDVEINFMNKEYFTLGSATLISIDKGFGYGATLKRAMMKYAKQLGKTSIGFCNPKLADYYKSLGLGILKNQEERFYYKENTGKILQFREGDVLYQEGSDNLIQEIINHPKEKIYCNRSSW